jgi:dTDP-glucose 4,6-dehydratase
MTLRLPVEDLAHVFDHTRNLWEELRGRRIFVTGGTGFFGCWLLETLLFANDALNLDATITILTRDPWGFQHKAPQIAGHPSVNCVVGDIQTFPFPQGRFSHVIHAGAPSGKGPSSLEIFDIVVQGTRRVLDFCAEKHVEKILLTSSGAVYGLQPPDLALMPETYPGAPDPLNGNAAYGEAKRAAEFLCAAQARQTGFAAKIARCFAFSGPQLPLDGHFAIGNFIRDALNGGPVRVSGDGTSIRSYLYAADLAIWLWTILFRGESCLPYNVGSEEPISIASLARAVADAQSPAIAVAVADPESSGRPLNRYVPSCEPARQLGLSQKISLPEQIRRTLDWHIKQSFES